MWLKSNKQFWCISNNQIHFFSENKLYIIICINYIYKASPKQFTVYTNNSRTQSNDLRLKHCSVQVSQISPGFLLPFSSTSTASAPGKQVTNP